MPGERRDAADAQASGGRLIGYAARFNSPTLIAGEFTEEIAPGAFARSLRENDVLGLLDHDTGRLLGRTSSGTLKLWEDSRGLAFDLSVAEDTPDGHAALALVGRRDLFGCSFGFFVTEEDWAYVEDELPVRTIIGVDLIEISIVALPAYPTTIVTLARGGRAANAAAARRRVQQKSVAARRAEMEQKFRGIQ